MLVSKYIYVYTCVYVCVCVCVCACVCVRVGTRMCVHQVLIINIWRNSKVTLLAPVSAWVSKLKSNESIR